jgi:hypothetical protein
MSSNWNLMTRHQQDTFMKIKKNEEQLLNVAEQLGKQVGIVDVDLLDKYEKLKNDMRILTNMFLYYGEKNTKTSRS